MLFSPGVAYGDRDVVDVDVIVCYAISTHLLTSVSKPYITVIDRTLKSCLERIEHFSGAAEITDKV